MADISSIKLPSGNTYDIKDSTARAGLENLATVATSGDYNDLSDKPTIPSLPDIMTVAEVDALFT